MRVLGASDVLALWERGAQRHSLDRSALLCAWARPELAADSVVDLPLGEVTTTLLQLRAATFGQRIRAHVDCERCGQRLELNLTTHELLQPTASGAPDVNAGGLRLRPPCLRDLAAIAHERDVERAARDLLARCMLNVPADAWTPSDGSLREIEGALEAIQPNADLAFDVHCEACGHVGTAQLDAGELLWDEIDAQARVLLGQVHVLASAYGWSEGEILALGYARRDAYLATVGV